jgi:glycosyltransferase involved in cell wall biosynthesis
MKRSVRSNGCETGDADHKGALGESLRGIRILLIGPSLNSIGGQAVISDYLHRHMKAEGVDVGFLATNPVPGGILRGLERIKYVRTIVVTVMYLGSLLRHVRRYDVMHVFAASYLSFFITPAPAILIGKMFRKRVILNYHSGEADDHLKRGGRSVFWFLRRADVIVVPSAYLVEVFGSYGFAVESIYNVVDPKEYAFRQRPTVTPHILVARNLEALYDIGTAIKVFRRINQTWSHATLTIAGYGPEGKSLKALVASLDLDGVKFMGRVERSEMPRLYHDADVMLNTSLIDNMPVSILEAFAAGLPVVTTDAGGIPYIVRHRENGMVAKIRDVEGLVAAMSELIRDSELRKAVIEGGRRDAERYSWDEVKWRWANIYRGTLDGDHA